VSSAFDAVSSGTEVPRFDLGGTHCWFLQKVTMYLRHYTPSYPIHKHLHSHHHKNLRFHTHSCCSKLIN